MVVRQKSKGIARKPKNVEEFIEEGGSMPQVATPQSETDEPDVKGLKLRLTVELLADVDEAVKQRRPAPSRHQWILEAIYEKLERDKTA
jgi:hypothetical protein